jgi:hypothetical protein
LDAIAKRPTVKYVVCPLNIITQLAHRYAVNGDSGTEISNDDQILQTIAHKTSNIQG